MKLNSKRSETQSGTQPRGIRDQNDPSIGSKLEPFMKSKFENVRIWNATTQHTCQNDPSIGSKLEPFIHETKFENVAKQNLNATT